MPEEHASRTRNPLDTIWTWTGATAISVGVLVFVFLSTGSGNLFQPSDRAQEDWLVVNRAFFGALIMALLLLALGAIALRYRLAYGSSQRDSWPRFQLLEGKEGPRDQAVALVTFLVLLLVPCITIYASIRAYLKKSIVAEYGSLDVLGDSFWSSRMSVFAAHCDNRPCFRFYPHREAFEWFWFSDFGLLLAILGALVTWCLYAVILVRHK